MAGGVKGALVGTASAIVHGFLDDIALDPTGR
jgi:hypothetical protein